jgi:N-alpha-acetyltransferase 30
MDSQANGITYRAYAGEQDLPHLMALVQSELSEPYVIYTFRYFLNQWPHLAFLAYSSQSPTPVGVIVCKQSAHKNRYSRGYIAMLSVDKAFRKRGIGSYILPHFSLPSQISYIRMKPRFHLAMGVSFVCFFFSFESS